MKKIFITGAGGFLGSELTKGLANFNYEIYGNDINFSYPISKNKNIKLLRFDLLKNDVNKEVNKIDIFIHNAAITRPSNISISNNLINLNLKLTINALKLAKKFKSKIFFYISSTSLYRNFKSNRYNERSKILGKDSYSKSKIYCEKICREFCKKNKIKFTILRIGNIYNGFEKIKWSRNNVSIIQQWIKNSKKNIFLKTNSFETCRDWTYTEDIPKALNSIIINNNNFNILNLVSPYVISDIDLMKKITSDWKLFKSNNNEKKNNATTSIYINKIKFKKWTSPSKGISLIKKNEKN